MGMGSTIRSRQHAHERPHLCIPLFHLHSICGLGLDNPESMENTSVHGASLGRRMPANRHAYAKIGCVAV